MARLLADITLHAGGGWEGHVFFLIKNPITGHQLSTNSYASVKNFCKEHNLMEDPEIMVFLNKLEFNDKYGWLVPKQFIEKHLPLSSASSYLKEIQK